MSVTITKYTSYNQFVHSAEINLLNTGKIKLALVTSAYVFSAAHTIFSPASSDADDPAYNEVATGSGYTTGGEVLAALSVNGTRFDADDVVWTALTKTFRGGVLYMDDTMTIVQPLIGYILFDSTPANIVMAGADFTVSWNASGIITF